MEQALDDPSWEVQRAAIKGIASLDTPEARDILLRSYRRVVHRNGLLFREALVALTSKGWSPGNPLEEALRRMGSGEFKGAADEGAAALEPLLAAAAWDEDNVQMGCPGGNPAAGAIGALGRCVASASAQETSGESDSSQGQSSCESLATLRGAACDAAIRALKTASWRVAEVAAATLADIGGDAAADALMEKLDLMSDSDHPFEPVWQEVARPLGRPLAMCWRSRSAAALDLGDDQDGQARARPGRCHR